MKSSLPKALGFPAGQGFVKVSEVEATQRLNSSLEQVELVICFLAMWEDGEKKAHHHFASREEGGNHAA